MSNDDPIKRATTAVELVSQVVKAAGDDPQVKLAAHELGKTAVTLTKAINVFLIPLALMNYAVEKARKYFEGQQFRDDLAEVAGKIPEEEIVEPKAAVAGPLLQALAFSLDEPPLKEMYLHLLASAMDRRAADVAHPAFVEIIKQMNSEEARLLRSILQSGESLPIVEIRKRASWWRRISSFKTTYWVLATHVQSIVRKNNRTNKSEPSEIPELPAMVDNWVRLGLVQVTYGLFKGGDAYDWVDSRPEIIRAREEHGSTSVWVKRGMIQPTSFGKMFATAVGLAVQIK